jgi:hypothetical protein
MTEFQRYGIHAQVRADGDLYVNAPTVTLGEAEGRELLGFLMTEYHQLDVDRRVVDDEPSEDDTAFNAAVTDLEYENREVPVIETATDVGESTVASVSTPDQKPPIAKRAPNGHRNTSQT